LLSHLMARCARIWRMAMPKAFDTGGRMKRIRTGEYKVFQFRQTDRHPQIALWILRILVQLGVLRKFVEKEGLENMNLARYLEFDDLQDYTDAFDAPVARQKIVARHKQLESRRSRPVISTTFYANLRRLAALLDLSDVDERVLEFAVALDAVPALSHATGYLGATSFVEMIRCLEIILKIDQAALKQSLHQNSILAKSGLVTCDRSGVPMEHAIDLLSEEFAERMMMEELEPIELIRDVAYRTSAPSLTLSDYAHIQDTLDILCPYLRHAVKNRRAGVNVYLYGSPGTGKTELAKVLARDVGCELYEVTCEDDGSDVASSGERMKAFSAAQNFFARRQAMILFDEVESVFGRDHYPGMSAALERKAWINRILETNPVPAIWISNSVDIDGAFLRRFDAVFEIPVPPKARRREIIRKTCDGLLNDDAVRRIAEPEQLAPALIARSSAVVRTISNEIGSDGVSGAIETLINSRLRARGDRLLIKEDANSRSRYEPDFLNADIDPKALVEKMRVFKEGRLCFYGSSGTGKTAFARWLVSQCKLPLIVKRGSDLVSPYVGQTERNIADAFGEAGETNSALLIDEFDCFLQDRRHASRNWEIAQVNEMLVQVDEYRGVFIATTNRLDAMDPAILRRFDIKVEFGYLTPLQIEVLFQNHCHLFGLDKPSSAIVNDLRQLTNVTAGDFAVISRQNRLNGIPSPEMLLSRLRKECAFREGEKRPIGFLN
jgi:transitional endoplasmic reticulum ATPase